MSPKTDGRFAKDNWFQNQEYRQLQTDHFVTLDFLPLPRIKIEIERRERVFFFTLENPSARLVRAPGGMNIDKLILRNMSEHVHWEAARYRDGKSLGRKGYVTGRIVLVFRTY